MSAFSDVDRIHRGMLFTLGLSLALSVPVQSGPLPVEGAADLRSQSSHRAADLGAPPAQIAGLPGNPAGQTAQVAPNASGIPAELLDEVTVSGTRRSVRPDSTTAVVYAIDRQDFQAQGAVTVSDALLLVPGFQQTTPALGGQPALFGNFLRGFDDSRYLVLRDGLSLQSPATGRSDTNTLPLDDIERIEVITGGASLRYGSGSVAGVINLITQVPKGPPRVTLTSEAGSYAFSRHTARFAGGDDTFSYNLAYTGITAQNNYPFRFELPRSARFYGPTTNPDSVPPEPYVSRGYIDPSVYPNAQFDEAGTQISGNSFGLGGVAGDAENAGPIDLFGFLKPEVGPVLTIQGTADTSSNASDHFLGKFTYKPNAFHKLRFRANQRNGQYFSDAPGYYAYALCYGGRSSAVGGETLRNPYTLEPTGTPANGTLNLERSLPLNPGGGEAPCAQQLYVPVTPGFNLSYPLALYNTSNDGRTIFSDGQAYPFEGVTGDISYYRQLNSSETELSLFWDWDIAPGITLSSYAAYYKIAQTRYRPRVFLTDTNYLSYGLPSPYYLSSIAQGQPGKFDLQYFGLFPEPRPYFEGSRFNAQTALTAKLSAGQTLFVGLDFLEDRGYTVFGTTGEGLDRSLGRTSLFAVDEVDFGGGLKANFGLRWTHSAQFGSVGTAAAGLRYQLADFLALRGNWSQVYNAPNINDLYGLRASLPNLELRPETGTTFDVGFDLTPAENLSVRLTYFGTQLDDTFQLVQTTNPVFGGEADLYGTRLVSQVRNANGQRASGIEVSGDWRAFERWRFRLAWTNVDSRPFGPEDSPDDALGKYPYYYGYQLWQIPFNSVTTAATYTDDRFTATLLGRYSSGNRRYSALDFTAAYWTLDLNVEVPVTPSFTLTGSIFNLTDNRYEYLDGNPAPGITFRLGGRVEFGGASR